VVVFRERCTDSIHQGWSLLSAEDRVQNIPRSQYSPEEKARRAAPVLGVQTAWQNGPPLDEKEQISRLLSKYATESWIGMSLEERTTLIAPIHKAAAEEKAQSSEEQDMAKMAPTFAAATAKYNSLSAQEKEDLNERRSQAVTNTKKLQLAELATLFESQHDKSWPLDSKLYAEDAKLRVLGTGGKKLGISQHFNGHY
jgi:hypothetical protein